MCGHADHPAGNQDFCLAGRSARATGVAGCTNMYLAKVSKWKMMTRPEESRHRVSDVGKTYIHEDVGKVTDHSKPAILDHHSWAYQQWISQTGGRLLKPSFLGEFLTTP